MFTYPVNATVEDKLTLLKRELDILESKISNYAPKSIFGIQVDSRSKLSNNSLVENLNADYLDGKHLTDIISSFSGIFAPLAHGVPIGYVPYAASATSWGTSLTTRLSHYASFAAAITAIGATKMTLVIDKDGSVDADVTTPSTLSFEWANSAKITIASAKTWTCNGKFTNDPTWQIFSQVGALVFGVGATSHVRPEWWGALGVGTDDTSALGHAIDAASTGGLTNGLTLLHRANANYGVTSGFLIDASMTYKGEDRSSSVITKLNDFGAGSYVFRLAPTSYISIGNFTLEGGGFTGDGIQVGYLDGATYYGPARPILRDIIINNHGGNGIYFRKGILTCFENIIVTLCGADVLGMGYYGDGIRIEGSPTAPDTNAATFTNIDIRNCQGWGLNLLYGRSNVFNNATIQGNGLAGGTVGAPVYNNAYGNIKINDRNNYLVVYSETAGWVGANQLNTGARQIWFTPRRDSANKEATGNYIIVLNGTIEDESLDKKNIVYNASDSTHEGRLDNIMGDVLSISNRVVIGRATLKQDGDRLFRWVISGSGSSQNLMMDNCAFEYDYRVTPDVTQTISYAMQNAAGCLLLGTLTTTTPLINDKFFIKTATDLSGGELLTAKGSALIVGDVFRVINNTIGTEAVEFVGAKGTGQANLSVGGFIGCGTGFSGSDVEPREQFEIRTIDGQSADLLLAEANTAGWRIRNLQSDNSFRLQYTTDFSSYTDKATLDSSGNLAAIAQSRGATGWFGGASHRTQFEADGTLLMVGDATVWDDLRVTAGSLARPGGSDPEWVSKTIPSSGVATYMLEFDENDIATFVVQLPHSYKEGTDLHVHAHWTPAGRGNEESGNVVQWLVDYSWANIDGTFGAMATADLTDACDGTDYKHQMTPSVSITGTSKTISSMLVCNIRRGSDNWATNTSGNCPILLEVDFHFEQDTIGSRAIGAK